VRVLIVELLAALFGIVGESLLQIMFERTQTPSVSHPWISHLRVSPNVYNQTGRTHLQRNFDVVVERDEEGFYVASVPALPGCHTQAKSLDELNVRIREAIELCLEVEGAPEHSLEFVGIQRITIAA